MGAQEPAALGLARASALRVLAREPASVLAREPVLAQEPEPEQEPGPRYAAKFPTRTSCDGLRASGCDNAQRICR